MNITEAQLDAQLAALPGMKTVLSWAGRSPWDFPDLLLAIASRESNITNIVGDFGHGRGCFQIDDRSWGAWLASVPGVRSGTWDPVISRSAAGSFLCPTLKDGLLKAASILHANWVFAQVAPKSHRAAIMVAGYNCGPGSALSGYENHGDPDHFTTGGDYSHDVFGRQTAVHRYFRAHGLR